ncbi:MAG: type II toxin-antitoxin system VapC family toxin [Chitinophagaceae bacterium]
MIWHLQGNSKLKQSLRDIIENPGNTLLVSQFSLIEMSVKLKLGKLPEFIVTIEYITTQLLSDGFTILPISNNHIFSYHLIPFFEDHRDPFDRFLLGTAFIEQIPIISIDDKFPRYRPLIAVID